MKLSKLFTKTQKEAPKDEDQLSAQLLLKGGFIHKLGSGSYCYLPLGFKVLTKIKKIIREEFEKAGAQEVLSRMVQPASLWQKSDRLENFGPELIRFKNRQEQEQVLATTHEEAITDMVKDHLLSYRDLPLIVNQIQAKYRDEPRPRGGLIRTREFIMQDAYSFDENKEELNKTYQKVKEAYRNIFSRCGLKTLIVDSDVGAMGGYGGQEFMLKNKQGEDKLIICPTGDYQANIEVAKFELENKKEKEKPLKEVKTPQAQTIKEVSQFLKVKPSRMAKMVFYTNQDNEIIAALVRGDLEVNQIKLQALLKTGELEAASREEVKKAGATPGYANPNDLKAKIIVDPTVAEGKNLVIGANKKNYHLKNYNHQRDFKGQAQVADIAQAQAGLPCPKCGQPLKEERGIEVGHTFKLGKKYSKSFDLKYLNKDGKEQIPEMGCYGIGLGRLMAAAVEANHDKQGIIWPKEISPFDYHLLTIGESKEVIKFAAKAYKKLQKEGKTVLYDDREESPGVKFNDADLMGCPNILTVSPQTVKKKKIELKTRGEGKKELIGI